MDILTEDISDLRQTFIEKLDKQDGKLPHCNIFNLILTKPLLEYNYITIGVFIFINFQT